MLQILLIHRSLKERKRLSALLKRSGFQVISSTDRQKGFRKFSDTYPDMIVMADEYPDAQMMCADMKEMSYLPILILGNGDDIARAKMLETGADMYVNPGIGNNELIARIYALLRRCQEPKCEKPRNGSPRSQAEFGEETINRTPTEFSLSSPTAIASARLVQ